jgi:hypothetical protein
MKDTYRGELEAELFKSFQIPNIKQQKILKDSIFVFRRNWAYCCGWTIYAVVLQFIIGSGNWAFPDGRPACLDDHSVNQVVCYSVFSLKYGSESLKFLTGFILGGFLLASVSLWRLRRSSYASLCGSTRNLLINICSIIEDEDDKRIMSRWCLLGYELSVLKSRGLIDSIEGRMYLSKLDLIQLNEWDKMIPGDRHTTVWFWIQTKANKLRIAGRIDNTAFQTICNAITLSRDKANDLMSCVDRDHPAPYVFVCSLLKNINVFFHVSASGVEWATWLYNHDGVKAWSQPGMWIELAILFLYSTIFTMLFDVCTYLHNPFGPRAIDVSHLVIGNGINELGKILPSIDLPETM